jgi:DNA-binding XRE family transcriptional regulator
MYVPYDAAMDIEVLRARLSGCRDRWDEVAALAGVSRKTLYRIADRPEYMPNLKTFVDIDRAIGIARPELIGTPGAPPAPQPERANGR